MLKGAAIGAGTDLALGGSPKSAAVAAVLGAAGLEPLAKGGKAVAQAVARKVLAKTAAEAAAPVAAKVASKGVEVAAKHNALMQFAKQVAQRNPKVGEKIWILLDEAGNPSKLLTPDQAGAAARKGLSTTWVKNLWAN
jgi:hypothetical protein